MPQDVVISVKNVKKNFHLPRHRSDSLKEAITQVFKKKDKAHDTYKALKGVSFDVQRGEFLGIVGRNGTGKSTLLKILAEIYRPSSGSVTVKGKLVPFIELGVGFNPNLTGRENVYLNGALLGFSKKEIDEKYDSIVEFAELEQFMDQKLKNYSSGMKVRLAFSVAIRANADILLLDEVLAVGDAAFQRKCYEYFDTLKRNKKTIIFVTHSMSAVRKYCDRAILLEKGKVSKDGDADEVATEYQNLFKLQPIQNSDKNSKIDTSSQDPISIVDVQERISEDKLVFNFDLRNNTDAVLDDLDIMASVYRVNEDGHRQLIGGNTKDISNSTVDISVEPSVVNTVELSMDNVLGKGLFVLDVTIKNRKTREVFAQLRNTVQFSNDSKRSEYYPVIIPSKFKQNVRK